MNRFHNTAYQGEGPEIVWVGEGAEVCALGYESDKYRFLKDKSVDVLSLGIRMGLFLPKVDEEGNPRAVIESFRVIGKDVLEELSESDQNEILLKDSAQIQALEKRWSDYVHRHIGIRSIGKNDTDWIPAEFLSRKSLQTRMPAGMVKTLQQLGLTLEIQREIQGDTDREKSLKDWQVFVGQLGFPEAQKKLFMDCFTMDENEKFFEVSILGADVNPFPFKVDLGGPLPTGWHTNPQGLLGLRKKDANSMNYALMMAHEVAYRALLNACMHPAQHKFQDYLSPEKMGLYFGSGIGPHAEHQKMMMDTLDGRPCGAKSLANCIVNIASGYISSRMGIEGKISTHVGACETCMGSIADVYWDLKGGRFEAGIAGGFDDTMTASSYNGFTSNLAFTTNEKLVKNLDAMIEEGVIEDKELQAQARKRIQLAEENEQQLKQLEKNYKNGEVDYYTFQKNRSYYREEKRKAYMQLPKEMTQFASMPFAKYRSGFVMGVGGGAGFFTTLDFAIENGLPIRAFVAGVSEMVPDAGGDGTASIAALGNGVGAAYEKSFLEAKKNYQTQDSQPLKIEDIGVWFSHGTSTPQNGWGERREIDRVHQKYQRNPDIPIFITGDKAEVGHRIAGNFPSLVGYIFENNEILPVGNYLQSGFVPKGRRGFGEALDDLFPSTQVVGRAGVGNGKPLAYSGDFIAANGAGFGRINTVLIFRRFNYSDIQASQPEDQEVLTQYPKKSAHNIDQREKLRKKILFGSEPLVR